MYLTDFLFDGVKLSSLGFLVGSAVTSNNESASAGSKLELQTVVNHGNHLTGITNATYNEPITVTFDIIKQQCSDAVSFEIEDNEMASLMRWLNRKEWCKFKPLYNDLSFPNVYFMGTFTDISAIIKGGYIVGLTLTLTTNAPWGFMEYDNNTFTITQPNGSFTVYDMSDELGNKYPEEVTILNTTSAGDLTLTNNLNQRETTIKNCKSLEVITLDCINKIITSYDLNQLVPQLSSSSSAVIYNVTAGTASDIWKVFDRSLSTYGEFTGNDVTRTGSKSALIGYNFTNPVSAKYASICWGGTNNPNYKFTVQLQASTDGTNWVSLSEPKEIGQTSTPNFIKSNSDEKYKYWGIRYLSYNVQSATVRYPQAHEIQFYSQGGDTHTRLYNDFNYVYPMFTNTMDDSKNIFSSTLPCLVDIKYRPIRKVGILV